MNTAEQFTINVNGKQYRIEPVADDSDRPQFRVFTDCDYLFTVVRNYDLHWQMESDVTPLNEDIAENIGSAIENHFA